RQDGREDNRAQTTAQRDRTSRRRIRLGDGEAQVAGIAAASRRSVSVETYDERRHDMRPSGHRRQSDGDREREPEPTNVALHRAIEHAVPPAMGQTVRTT